MKRDQIFNELKQRIATGEYAAGEKLPTEFELSAQYAVARGTVRQSLKRLEEEGYLERIKSKGTFIRRPPGKSNADKVISFLIPYPGYIRPNNDPVFITFHRLSTVRSVPHRKPNGALKRFRFPEPTIIPTSTGRHWNISGRIPES